MPQPTSSQVHVDAVLTNISLAYEQEADNFIAGKVFPTVPVEKQSDKYFTYTKNDWFRDEAQVRADGDESVGSGYGISTSPYYCDVYAIHKDIGDQTRKNADSPINVDSEAAKFVTQRLLVRREIQFVTDYMTTSVWGTDMTGVSASATAGQTIQWNDYTNSDPIDDIEDGKAGILSVTGMEANTLVLGYDVFRSLKNHPDLVDRIKYTSSQTITADMLAAMFDIERVIVAKAVKATNAEGATAAYSFAVGKNALLCHVASEPGLLTPSAGYIFEWTGVSDGMGETIGTSSFYIDEKKSTRVEAEKAWDNKVVATDLGYFFATIVA
jgi:hypothetical protein